MDLGKLRVGIGELKFDWARGFGPAASDFGKRVFKSGHHVDPHAMFCAGHWIEDRLAATFRYTPLTTKCPRRAATSDLKSIGAKIGSWSFSRVEAKTLKIVAPGFRVLTTENAE